MELSNMDICNRAVVLVGSTKKNERHRPANGADDGVLIKHYLRTKTGRKSEEEQRRNEKRRIGGVEEDNQSKKPRLSTLTSTSSTSAYVAFTELWGKTMKQYEDRITELQEQLWEQQQESESLARAYNEETRAARRRIEEAETENTVLKEKISLTRKTMEGLKNLMEL